MEHRDVIRLRIALGVILALLLCSFCSGMTALVLVWSAEASIQPEDAVAVFAAAEFQDDPTESPEPPDRLSVSDYGLRVEVIRDTPVPTLEAGKRVLIYHTHTWEAYTQIEGDLYQETEKWRTKDEKYNVIAVGEALAQSLRALGCTVVHDQSVFEPPDLESAYERSLMMLEKRKNAGETYDLYLDVHRDAISSQSTIKRTVNIGGEAVARFMVLVGKGSSSIYAEKPDWEANLAVAQVITDRLNEQCDALARDVKIKTGRFNQHVADHCVLLECGHNGNTLEEVLRGIPYLAQAVADALDTFSISENEKIPDDA